MKPSSRAGRFKKKLVTESQLQAEAPLIEAKMAPFLELYHLGKLTAPEYTALFILTVLTLRHPKGWRGSKRPSLTISHQLNYEFEGLPLGTYFSEFALRAVPEAVNRALLQWSSRAYPLELMFRIPNPREVLNQQKEGKRCVTVLTEATRTSRYILGERDTLSFTLHDLIHADHFYFNNQCYQGQLGLYRLLDQEYNVFTDLLSDDGFEREFEYLIADMNAYAIHLLKCLKSAVLHYGPVEFWNNWIQKFPVKRELSVLNTPAYSPLRDDHVLLMWLNEFTI
jgi:hypothetical protein